MIIDIILEAQIILLTLAVFKYLSEKWK